MALQFWLLIKYEWSWRRPASLSRQDLTRHRRRLGRTIQNPSKIWLKKEKQAPSYCSRLCCIHCRLYLSMLLCKVSREWEAASGLQGLRRGRLLFSSLLLPLTRRRGFSSFTLSPLQQQTWPASCDQTKLSSLLFCFPSLISWKASAAGCPRLTNHLPSSHPVQRLDPSPTAKLYCHLLATAEAPTRSRGVNSVKACPNKFRYSKAELD